MSKKEGIDRLELDVEHFRSYGLDSGALYDRICKYLDELKERRSEVKSINQPLTLKRSHYERID